MVKVKYSGLAVFPLTLTGHNFFIKNNFLVLFEDLKGLEITFNTMHHMMWYFFKEKKPDCGKKIKDHIGDRRESAVSEEWEKVQV